MSTAPESPSVINSRASTRTSRRIPHSVFGIGAFLLLVLAALILIVLSGQHTRDTGAMLAMGLGVPLLIAFTALVAKRWRRARLGRTG